MPTLLLRICDTVKSSMFLVFITKIIGSADKPENEKITDVGEWTA